jgi:mono/diheme cytochrome c family protein
MIRRIGIILGGIVVLGLLAFIALAWRSSIPAISRPSAASFSANSIARGESLAAAGHCASCHTGPGGQQFAGGYGVNTPFGIIYGTNITPDPESGIGNWSLAAFTRAMREGVSRDGRHLFPAFPYWAFTKLSDEDTGALYAYLMTLAPARSPAPRNTLPFPLSIRAFQAGWKLLFFRNERFQRNPSKER